MKQIIAAAALASILLTAPAAAAPPAATIGDDVALAVWARAQNRGQCAPLALASNGGVAASPRMADFSSGWGVAFDTPRTRSAYGFAGTGLLPQDGKLSDAAKRAALIKQWPYTRDVGRTGKLPRGSFAGYGLEGAGRYARANPQGRGQKSLAYLRIPGQPCMYNVWSKVSRAHLEKLLDNLVLVPNAARVAPAAGEPDFTPFIARLRVPSKTQCSINSERPLPCTMTRDQEGVLSVRIGGKEPLLVNVWPSQVDLFAVVGRKNVPILVTDFVPHPGALDCIWSKDRSAPVHQICVDFLGE